MDNGLSPVKTQDCDRSFGVLILIVMDNGLSPLNKAKAKKAEVLILIVMDNGLSLRQPGI